MSGNRTSSLLYRLLPWALGVFGVGVLVHWTTAASRGPTVVLREPGADRLGITPPVVAPADLRGTFSQGTGTPSSLTGDWPRFRGDNFDNVAAQAPTLPDPWPKSAPRKLWQIDLGEGYAGAAVRNGRVYLLDYDPQARADALRCLSLDDGREIWSRRYPVDVKRNHGMSRTVPAVSERVVVTLGPKCHVLAVDADSGEYLWGIDLVARFGTKVPPWYAGQCPLIDNGRVILATAGSALMVAVDALTGSIVWQTPNPLGWEMTHSSIIPMTLGERKLYLYCASGGVVGVSADDGAILFQTSDWKVSMANVPSPVVIGEDKVLLTGGYGAGAALMQLVEASGKIEAKVVYRLPPEVFGSEQQTPIYYNGHVFGVIPGGQLVCLDPADGRVKWTSGATRFGIGPYLLADDRLLLLNDTGRLSVVRATPNRFELQASFVVLDKAHESWAPMALAGSRLLLRDVRRLACFDLLETSDE